jgi:hypothetical protein
MSASDRGTVAVLIFAGLGIGVVCGTLVGFLLGRRPKARQFPDVAETVQDLRNRAEQVLSELSASVSSLDRLDGSGDTETQNILSASIIGRNGTEEAMG